MRGPRDASDLDGQRLDQPPRMLQAMSTGTTGQGPSAVRSGATGRWAKSSGH